jgi:hypothetical protein
VRADIIHRDWHDFYSNRTDLQTGRIVTGNGPADLTLVENNDSLYERRYDGLLTQFHYNASTRLDLGGNWTWSHTKGNFDGETRGSGPVPGVVGKYPEYNRTEWNNPTGDLTTDQRHRVSLYGIFKLFSGDRQSLSVSLLQSYFSGRAYEEVGSVTLINPATQQNYVANPGYLTPPVRATYYFSGRGSLRTPSITRTDLSFNYAFKLAGLNLFVIPQVTNVFNQQKVDTTDSRFFDASIATADNRGACRNGLGGRCQAFNPFTETPVEGVNWQRGAKFGQAINPIGYQTPRTFLFTAGLRF